MNLDIKANLASGNRHRRLTSHVLSGIAVATALTLTLLSNPGRVRADDGRSCSHTTLKGDYGLVATGTRGTPSGAIETFVTIALVTYDGNGTFTSIGTSHGSLTGVRSSTASGTYQVNADCTGTETTNLTGAPPLVDNFVIVDKGREVRTAVTSPANTIATANLRAK